jgi:hypothetical protein
MNVTRRMIPAFVATILFSLSSPVPSGARSASQLKLRSGKFHVRSACMMPPEGHLIKFGLKGSSESPEKSDIWARALEAFVETHLKSADISIEPAFAILSSGASEDEVHQVILDIQEKYHSISRQLEKKPNDIGKSAYTLGDQVAMLPCAANSDLLVFVHGQTENNMRTNRLAVLTVTMADAKSGEILAFLHYDQVDPGLDDPEDGTLLDDDLSTINLGSARKNAIARDRDGVYR